MDHIARGIGIAFLLGIVGAGIACDVAVWRECRAAGHSKATCLRWVSR